MAEVWTYQDSHLYTQEEEELEEEQKRALPVYIILDDKGSSHWAAKNS